MVGRLGGGSGAGDKRDDEGEGMEVELEDGEEHGAEELEVIDIVRWVLLFKGRPEFV